MRPKTLFACSLAISALALAPAVTNALPFVGQPAPVADYGADDGTELWRPNDVVLNVELYDGLGDTAGWKSSFGFYRESNPANLITVFSAEDQYTTGDVRAQQALIDFARGIVIDYDEFLDSDDLVLESIFTPGDGAIGFFVHLEAPSSELTLYTQAELNTAIAGQDAFATWPNETMPDVYLLGAEFGPQQMGLRLDLVYGVSAIPEPKAAVVFAFGFLVIGVALRRGAPLPGC